MDKPMGDKYITDHTKFIAEMKRRDPGIEEGQRRGRAILWDKRIDLEQSRRFQQSEVAQPPYVYQNYVGPPKPEPGDTRTPGTPATNKS
jgi:hypothetical protein